LPSPPGSRGPPHDPPRSGTPPDPFLSLLLAVLGMIDWEFDCYCCHGPEVHEMDLVRMARGKCLVKDCVHECKQYSQAQHSAFFKLLELIDGILNREEKRKALLAEDWSLEEWLKRYRGRPWPEKISKKESA